jgi:hypothetical protein
VSPVRFHTSDIFESNFGIFNIDGVKIDLMSPLKLQASGWVISPPEDTHAIDFCGMKLLAYPLQKQLETYMKIGRDKDKQKIKLIKGHFQEVGDTIHPETRCSENRHGR